MFKVIIFAVFFLITAAVLVKHTNDWGIRFRQYMTGQANSLFGSGAGWERPWAILLSKAMVVFFGLMFIVFVYVVCFSQW